MMECDDTPNLYTFKPFKIERVYQNLKQRQAHLKQNNNRGIHTPLPRSGHRVICIGSNLYVFGGYNQFIRRKDYDDEEWLENYPLFKELWKFDTLSRRWTRLWNVTGMPNELASHSAVSCNPYMIVYGGTSTPFGEASSNDVHICYLPKSEWSKLATHGHIPPTPMYGQAVCREDNDLYVVGGTTGYDYSLDVHVLNLKTLEWKYLVPDLVKRPTFPHSRYRHEITHHEKSLYIFGGGTSEEAYPLDLIPTFELEHCGWTMTRTYPDPSTGEFPKPRKCHVLIKYKSNVYIQGGTNEDEHLSDFWKLDLRTMAWQMLAGKTEKPIYFHSGAVTEEGTIYLFGGIWETEVTRCNKVFKVHVDVPSLQTMAWQAVDFYAPKLADSPPSKLLELGIPRFIVESLKMLSDVG